MGRDDSVDLTRTAAAVAATTADLIALQELDCGLERTGGVNQAERLQELTGLNVHFFPTLRRNGGSYGLGLAVRGRVSARLEALPRIAHEEPRGAIVGRWQELSLVAAHLAPVDEDPEGAQLRAIACIASALDAPVIVLGDLNRAPADLGPLEDAGFTAGGHSLGTFGPRLRRLPIDHVLAGPGLTVSRRWTVESSASDHLPVVAQVETA
jgi:endonuclease/exonuclease/phosphatase family metal-dependent hydrolase